jgi:DNA polymerase phi
MSGQEERDVLFARLFGIASIIQSGLIVRTQPLSTSGSATPEASSLSGYSDIITHLLVLGDKKPWLRESAWWTVGLAVDQLHTCSVPWREDALEFVLEKIFVNTKIWSPEKVALAVKLQRYWPRRDWRNLYAPTIKHGDILHTGNMGSIAKILKVR